MILVKLKAAKMKRSDESHDPNYDFVDAILPADHEDCNNYKCLAAFGLLTGYDFNYIRSAMAALLVADGGFDAVVEDQDKKILAQWVLATEAEALTVGVTASEYDGYVDLLLENTKKGRGVRVERARKDFGREIVKGTMSYAESDALHADSKDLFESFSDANNQEFIAWINSSGVHVGNGFLQRSYGSEARRDKLIDRIVNGKK